MSTLRLTNGITVLLDEEDVEKVSRHNWYYHTKAGGSHEHARARTKIGGAWVYMHRYILDLWDRDKVVDHINHDALDNRKENLRVCFGEENARNQKKLKTLRGKKCKSAYKGVTQTTHSPNGYGPYTYWRAQISIDGVPTYLGQFKTEEDAARAYDEAAIKNYGEFALTNFNNEGAKSD